MVIANYQSSFVPEENRGSTSKLTRQQLEIITYVLDNIRNQSRELIKLSAQGHVYVQINKKILALRRVHFLFPLIDINLSRK